MNCGSQGQSANTASNQKRRLVHSGGTALCETGRGEVPVKFCERGIYLLLRPPQVRANALNKIFHQHDDDGCHSQEPILDIEAINWIGLGERGGDSLP